MLKILTAKQIRELDAYTIRNTPILSINLMERACREFVGWFAERFDTQYNIGVICGTGNNGGDGLGIARMLSEMGYTVTVWVVRGGASESEDFRKNLERLRLPVNDINAALDQDVFQQCNVLIDAIFGSGLSRPVEGLYANVIDKMNASDAMRIAVDIPSGLMSDSHSIGSIVKAHHTVSFQLPKLAFLMPENNRYTGTWHLVKIGLIKDFIKEASSPYGLLQKKDIHRIRKIRSTISHKGTFGRALLISGSYGKMGAAVLASRAALRAGVGLLTVHLPACGYVVMQTAVPEAMVQVDTHPEYFTAAPHTEHFDAVGIGPGLGQNNETMKALGNLLEKSNKPVVLDADALNILAARREYLHLLPGKSILTPHPKEFERLAGSFENDFHRLEKLKEFAAAHNVIVVLKGAWTAIAFPDGTVRFNSTGNPGMATGGTGDVLTGILTSLLAQSYSPEETAIFGVYLHGLAGDLAVHEKSYESLIASDLTEFLPVAFKRLSL